jgi:hypothetical protein
MEEIPMPKLKKEFPVTLSFRTTESEAKKVAAFAEYTGRGQGEVLRLLLRQAVLAEHPISGCPRSCKGSLVAFITRGWKGLISVRPDQCHEDMFRKMGRSADVKDRVRFAP